MHKLRHNPWDCVCVCVYIYAQQGAMFGTLPVFLQSKKCLLFFLQGWSQKDKHIKTDPSVSKFADKLTEMKTSNDAFDLENWGWTFPSMCNLISENIAIYFHNSSSAADVCWKFKMQFSFFSGIRIKA